MTNLELLELYSALDLKELNNLAGVKFSYAVAKNLNSLLPDIKSIEATLKFSKLYDAYEKERIELAKKHAKKEAGKPVKEIVIENGRKIERFVLENTEKFNKELEVLRTKHKKALDEREKQISQYEDLLKEEVKVKLYKVNLKDVPKDITPGQIKGIYAIIEE